MGCVPYLRGWDLGPREWQKELKTQMKLMIHRQKEIMGNKDHKRRSYWESK
jgi:hypothetical protein